MKMKEAKKMGLVEKVTRGLEHFEVGQLLLFNSLPSVTLLCMYINRSGLSI